MVRRQHTESHLPIDLELNAFSKVLYSTQETHAMLVLLCRHPSGLLVFRPAGYKAASQDRADGSRAVVVVVV
jgi:hypothetical protein